MLILIHLIPQASSHEINLNLLIIIHSVLQVIISYWARFLRKFISRKLGYQAPFDRIYKKPIITKPSVNQLKMNKFE